MAARTPSLSTRLATVAALVLAAFLGLTGSVLDRAFRQSVEDAVRENLQTQVYLLLGAAELDDDGSLSMPEILPEPRLSSPASGLYAAVQDTDGNTLWRSTSSLGREISYAAVWVPGEPAYGLVASSDNEMLYSLSYAVTWELSAGVERPLMFQVAQARAEADAQVAGFRRALWIWLGAAAIVLVLAQALVLRWGLAPLRQVAREVRDIEQGKRSRLEGDYPRELLPLTRNVNALLGSGAARLQRYRDSLADLAHSLKTPLAVLRSVVGEGASGTQGQTVSEQVERMDQAIAYHMQRGAAAGRTALASALDPGKILQRIGASLTKVYGDKLVELEVDIPEGTVFVGDPGDLTEVLGNLLDNAYKWCRKRIRVRMRNGGVDGQGGLLLEIEDDGPGIPPEDRRAVLERGVRTDELVPGQGIGLTVVREMVEEAYGGSLEIARSDLGGARLQVSL